MAPQYPDEVNVFIVPHSRMKNLVDAYRDQLLAVDFHNHEALEALLPLLEKTFTEFKTHEHIENQFIMERLKQRLKLVNAGSQAVCNCHGDNRLVEILNLLKDGYTCTDRISFGSRLRKAVTEFTEKFIPHMAEEEEVFQPLLVKYFAREELLLLKEQVIQQHEIWKEKLLQQKETARVLLELLEKVDENGLQTLVDRTAEKFAQDQVASSKCGFSELPAEMVTRVFSYLSPLELTRCARVSKHWNVLAYSPDLWRRVYPTNWAKGLDGFIPHDPLNDDHEDASSSSPFDDNYFVDQNDSEGPPTSQAEKEVKFYQNFIRYGLVRMGDGVQHLDVAGGRHLSGSMLRSMLALCPNVRHLDASYTFITDISFKGLATLDSCSKLEYLDLSGCRFVTDVGLERLGACFRSHRPTGKCCGSCKSCPKTLEIEESVIEDESKTSSPGLQHLNLSGCTAVTDNGLLSLLDISIETKSLRFLDLSGCWRLSGPTLKEVAGALPALEPEHLSYCDMIQNGPHPTSANGCQNLNCPARDCCAYGQ